MKKEKVGIGAMNGEWIPGNSEVKPKDMGLYIVYNMHNECPLRVCQYRDNMFCDIRDILLQEVVVFGRFYVHEVNYWKPIDLPSEANDLLDKIEEGNRIADWLDLIVG